MSVPDEVELPLLELTPGHDIDIDGGFTTRGLMRALDQREDQLRAQIAINQELREKAQKSLEFTDCEGDCISNETCPHNMLKKYLEVRP